MKKRIMSALLALCLAFSMLPGTALAAGTVVASGNCGAEGDGSNVTWTLDSDGLLTISGTGEMKDYGEAIGTTQIVRPWESYHSRITRLTVEDGVSSIGGMSFDGCANLAAVFLPESLTVINTAAFQGCTGLESIDIPNSVTLIEENAFFNSGLTAVEIPANAEVMPIAFNNCANLKQISVAPGNSRYIWANGALFSQDGKTLYCRPAGLQGYYRIPETVESIQKSAFGGCIGLTGVSIPESVTSLGVDAFSGCTGLTAVKLPKGLDNIATVAFYGCTSLTSVTVPSSVTEIRSMAFSGCTALTDVYYSGSAAEWNAVVIGEYNESLSSAEIHYNSTGPEETVIDSGECGAQGDNLTWTLDANGLLTISGTGEMMDYGGRDAPWYEQRLDIKTAVIDNGVTRIGDGAFRDCSSLTSITISDGVTSIGSSAFRGCRNLTNITIPDGVTSILYGVFYGCSGLTGITLPESVTSIGNSAFYGCSSLTSITIPDGVTSIGNFTFYGCSSLTSITIPNGVMSIGNDTFRGCSSLTGITIPDGVMSIGNSAFRGCSSLTGITIPDGVTSIGNGTFFGCGSLAEITLPDSVTSIGNDAFYVCSSLAEITLPDGVTSIGDSAFSECSSLTNITLPNSITSIKDSVFFDCRNLTNITLPEGVTSIGVSAFLGCLILKDVEYSGTKAQWEQITIEAANDPLTKYATIHCTDGDIFPEGIVASGNCGAEGDGSNVTWTLDANGVLTISGTGAMKDYHPNISYAPWYEQRLDIKIAVINSGVTNIGNYAFSGCSSLMGITIPDSVTILGGYAFWDCSSLRSITIPDNVTSIGDHAFGQCKNLETVTIPDSVTILGGYAFLYCSSLTSFTIPNSVTSINEYTFDGCVRLKNITIPNGVTSVGEYVFNGCNSLTRITIPNSVTSIRDGAFYLCTALTDVYYAGSETEWQAVSIEADNDPLINARIHYNSTGPGDTDEWENARQLPAGVKYVPYSEPVDQNVDSLSGTQYQLYPGDVLPSGLSLDRDTGVISGVPMMEGTMRFHIQRFALDEDANTYYAFDEVVPCALTIYSNTDDAVQRPNDYEITKPVGDQDPQRPNHFFMNEYRDEVLIINGPYSDFTRLLIDGRTQKLGEDYLAEEGSTVITIHAKTFRAVGEGSHTIAAEFRANGQPDGELKRVAQNYTLSLPPAGSSGNSSGGGGNGGTHKPSKNPNAQQTQNPQPPAFTLPFTDVLPTDWFYEDLVWAYQEGLILGVSNTRFAPKDPISGAAVVTVLARMARVDLSQFEGVEEEGILSGQSFTPAAVWARRSGILPEGSAFTGSETAAREQMAVMLAKYLQSMGKEVSTAAQPVVFADADAMSPEGNEAFQTLYQSGIFRGTGGLRMNPGGSTTRAHFVALIHRLSVFAQS